MSKKNLIIIITTIFFSFIVLFLYLYFSDKKELNNNKTDNTEQGISFPTAEEEKTDYTNDSPTQFFNENDSVNYNNLSFKKILNIYNKPVAKSTIIKNKDNINIVRFIERSTGNIYDYFIKNNSDEPKRITNKTIHMVYDGLFSDSGEEIVFKLIDEKDNLNIYVGKIDIKSTTSVDFKNISGVFIENGIEDVVLNKKGTSIFKYFKNSNTNGSYGILSSIENTNNKNIFNSPLSLFNIEWINDNIISFTTKPSYQEKGFLFFFDINNQSFEKVMGNIKGLITKTNNDASFVLYSQTKDKKMELKLYSTKNKESTSLNINTLADKCVWSVVKKEIIFCAIPKEIKDNQYPDSWYKGIVSFNDDLWMIDTKNNTTKKIFTNTEDLPELDMTDLKISPDDKYISFINKNDLSLWLLDLSEEKSNIE